MILWQTTSLLVYRKQTQKPPKKKGKTMLQTGETFEFKSVSYIFLEITQINIKANLKDWPAWTPANKKGKWTKERLLIKALSETGDIEHFHVSDRKLLAAVGIKTLRLIESNRTDLFYCNKCANNTNGIQNSQTLIFEGKAAKHLNCFLDVSQIVTGFFLIEPFIPASITNIEVAATKELPKITQFIKVVDV